MNRHRGGLGIAVIAAAVVVPLVLTAYRRHPRDYTRSPEFKALIGDYIL